MKLKQYQEAYEKLKSEWQSEPSWLRDLRGEAMASFEREGFPTSRDEAWRFTDVAPLRETVFDVEGTAPKLSLEILEKLKRQSGPNFLLVVNGKFVREHSAVEKGIEALDLADAVAAKPDAVRSYLSQGDDAFSFLNLGLSKHGLWIRVPAERRLTAPIRVVFFAGSAREQALFQLRNIFVMEKNSKASLLVSYISQDGKGYFTNVVTEIILEEGAALEHSIAQREHPDAFHIAKTRVTQRRSSVYRAFALSTGAKLMRYDCRVALAEEGASCALSGLYLGGRDQLLDHQTLVDHQKPDGKSEQFFKGILAGNARGVFNGRVIVRQDAQRTDAHQTHKCLLLSEAAKVDAQPQLEILADDVKCSHGSAVGQLQEDALFYLRSRGIDEKEAGRILAEGFAREVIERSGLEFAFETLLEWVNQKLGVLFRDTTS